MNNCFIILAAGNSSRFKSKIPKQFSIYNGKLMINHSINTALKSKLFSRIIVVISKKHKKYIKNLSLNKKDIIFGGRERHDSSLRALKYIKKFNYKNVFIHDAARPNVSIKLLKNLNKKLINNKAVVPYLKISDSVKYKYKKDFINLERDNLLITQTPQCFNYKFIYNLSKNNKKKVTDESSLVIRTKNKVQFIKGEINNFKITEKNINRMFFKKTFYGIGFDVHRLVPNRKLFLGGLKINSKFGTLGHSDGDPVLHAITDSILGACKKGDIGNKFSDKNKKFKNIRSTILLKKVIDEIKKDKIYINNIDINIITEKPKIKNYKSKMIKVISKICKIKDSQINIKGKTSEKLGLIGKEKAIACEVITSVNSYE